jgi:hypothetical protein
MREPCALDGCLSDKLMPLRIQVFVVLFGSCRIVLFRHERLGAQWSSGGFVEDAPTVPVQARAVEHFVAVEPQDESLIGAPPLVLYFALTVVALIRARLGDLYDTPEFAGLAVFFMKVVSISEESYAYQIRHNRTRLKPFEHIHPRVAARTYKIGSSQRNFPIRNV